MKKRELYEMWKVHEEALASQDAGILELKSRVDALEKAAHELKRAIHRNTATIRLGLDKERK